jgi:predicted metalloprotease
MSGCARAGGGGLGLKAGGAGLAIIVALAALILPKLLNGGGVGTGGGQVDDPGPFNPSPASTVATNTPGGGGGGGGGECDTETAQILCGAVTDVNEFWTREFQGAGQTYSPAKTVFFSGQTETACGVGSAQTGPFYCPLDSKAYFDLDFLDQLQAEFDAPGDLASQYIVAHEYGHHVQNLLGISAKVRDLQSRNPGQANAYSVRLELQADCLAGAWAHDAAGRTDAAGQPLIDPNEIDEALNAAAAVGDDRIQRRTTGQVNPESWTHGSSEQRQTWFRRGFESGNTDNCNTFAE